MLSWLEQHLLPCAYKTLLGINCPICGFQRSFIALLKGDLSQSFAAYPPLVPVLLLCLLFTGSLLYKKAVSRKVMVTYSWFVLGVVLLNYMVKLVSHAMEHTGTA